jgi:hypothetical protein
MDKIKFIKVKIKKILDPYNRPNKMNIGLNNKKKIIKKKKKKKEISRWIGRFQYFLGPKTK